MAVAAATSSAATLVNTLLLCSSDRHPSIHPSPDRALNPPPLSGVSCRGACRPSRARRGSGLSSPTTLISFRGFRLPSHSRGPGLSFSGMPSPSHSRSRAGFVTSASAETKLTNKKWCVYMTAATVDRWDADAVVGRASCCVRAGSGRHVDVVKLIDQVAARRLTGATVPIMQEESRHQRLWGSF